MQLVRGNRAIVDHTSEGRSLLLFQAIGRGQYRFVDEFTCAGYALEDAPDREGRTRRAFVFQLMPTSALAADLEASPIATQPTMQVALADLRARALEAAAIAGPQDPSTTLRRIYERSTAVRQYVLARAAGRCEGCGSEAPFLTATGVPYLEPHHIRRLSDGGPDDPRHMAGLCPNCHRRVHHGADGPQYNRDIALRISESETQV